MDADCVHIWSNETLDDKLHFFLKYEWLSGAGKEAPSIPSGTAMPYNKRWMELFLRGESVNGPIAKLPQEDQDLLGSLGLTSTITIPLFYQAKTIPIVAMTANAFLEDIEKSVSVGMNGHIGKPIDLDEVMKELRQYLQ